MAEVQSATDGKPRFSRILLKLSARPLAARARVGTRPRRTGRNCASKFKGSRGARVSARLVIGAGNFIRGSDYERAGWIARLPTRWHARDRYQRPRPQNRARALRRRTVVSAIEMQACASCIIAAAASAPVSKRAASLYSPPARQSLFHHRHRREPARDGNAARK